VHILVTQGAVTTVIALLYALIPSVSSAYWILSVMTTQVYLIVYLLMFVAAVRLRRDQPEVQRGYTAPALTFMCSMGFIASAAAIIIGFVPPSQFESGSGAAYAFLILAGTGLIGLIPPALFLRLRKPNWKTPEGAGTDEGAAPAAAEMPPVEKPATVEPTAAAAPASAPPPPPALPAEEPSSRGGHRWIYWLVGAVVVVLLVIGLITFSGEKKNAEAQAKAQQLTQAYQQAGLPVPPSQDTIITALGTDGGAVCENPANALGKAALFDQINNGADFVGRRPIIVDLRIVKGEALILQTYCPEKLPKYEETIAHLKYEQTIRP
jgi:amino acid transporter